MISYEKCTRVMKAWGKIGQYIEKSQRNVDWTPVGKIIEASEKFFTEERGVLADVLKHSNERLGDLDPFSVDLGGHRWLKEEREEAYSDWLKWVLEQLRKPALVGQVFGIKKNRLLAMQGSLKVCRETRIISEEMKLRRTDLDIWYGTKRAVRVEVKIRDAGYLDLQQLMDQENHPEHFLHYIFLVRSGSLEGYKVKFEIRYWKDVCLNLRRMMPRLSLVFMQKAMIMAFVGAVEQNILKFPGNLPQLIASKVRFNSSVGKHIEDGLKGQVV
jgi:hypothetical protein